MVAGGGWMSDGRWGGSKAKPGGVGKHSPSKDVIIYLWM